MKNLLEKLKEKKSEIKKENKNIFVKIEKKNNKSISYKNIVRLSCIWNQKKSKLQVFHII